jgi:pilus assembly protein Flp/PilA
MKLVRKILLLVRSRSGATAIEYGLIAGLIGIAIVGGATALGESANDSYTAVSQQVPWG